MKENKYFKVILIIIYYLFLNTLVSIPYALTEKASFFIKNISMIMSNVLMIVAILYIMRNNLKGQFHFFKEKFKKNICIMVKYWLIGFILMLIANYIVSYLIMGSVSPNEETNRSFLANYPLFYLFSALIAAPITEELVFRLNFKSVIQKRIPYIIITGLVFASMHVLLQMENIKELLYMIPYGILGMSLSAIYYDTDNIYASIFMHFIHNLISILVVILF